MSGRKFFVAGNVKCFGSREFYTDLVKDFNDATFPSTEVVEVLFSPPHVYLQQVASNLRKDFALCAQNCYHKVGAFTGETSAEQLKDIGVPWVILGHSETRTIYHETNEVAHALSLGLKVIVCVGERLEDREADKTLDVIFDQLKPIADSVGDWSSVVIAYEPLWAIGTGVAATPEQAQEVHLGIRKWLSDHVSSSVAASTRIIYGGSVMPDNSRPLAKQPDIDGFLVGICTRKVTEFVPIIEAVSEKGL